MALRAFATRVTSYVLMLALCSVATFSKTAQAEVISAEAVLQHTSRAKVEQFLSRAEVVRELERYGVSHREAIERLRSLSDQEVQRLMRQIDQQPAGGHVGTIIGAVVFVFVLLLITDILGLTKVYPFTRSIR